MDFRPCKWNNITSNQCNKLQNQGCRVGYPEKNPLVTTALSTVSKCLNNNCMWHSNFVLVSMLGGISRSWTRKHCRYNPAEHKFCSFAGGSCPETQFTGSADISASTVLPSSSPVRTRQYSVSLVLVIASRSSKSLTNYC